MIKVVLVSKYEGDDVLRIWACESRAVAHKVISKDAEADKDKPLHYNVCECDLWTEEDFANAKNDKISA